MKHKVNRKDYQCLNQSHILWLPKRSQIKQCLYLQLTLSSFAGRLDAMVDLVLLAVTKVTWHQHAI